MSEREQPREIKPHLKAIEVPEGIRTLAGWLIWRYEAHEAEKKPRKVPYWTSGGRRHGVHGRPEDRASLTTFDAAKAAAARRGFDGVGFAMLPEWDLAALDFDGCVGAEGLDPRVEALIGHTYAEYSPSGRGVRAIVKGNLGNHRSPTTATDFGFETYSTKGFVTFTGNRLEITELLGNDNRIGEITPALTEICQRRFSDDPRGTSEEGAAQPLGLTLAQAEGALDVLDPDMPREPWRNYGMALHHEFSASDEAFELWDTWSQKSPKYPGRNGLLAQWESFGRRDGRPVTARSLIKAANASGAHINLSMASPSDFEVIGSTTEVRDAAVGKKDSPVGAVSDGKAEPPSRFPVIPIGEFVKRPRPTWLIKKIMPRAGLMVLFGDSGSGKTFLALDLAMAVARGVPWRAYPTKKGKVAYIVAEGTGGFPSRADAYGIEHSLDWRTLDFGIIDQVPNLLVKEDALDVAKSILSSMGKLDLIVIDTLAQTTAGGNENSGEDMSLALTHCRGIHRATGALVLLVHHSGKDASKGARGHSSLKAAADTEMEVAKYPTGRKVRISKMKDGKDGLEFGFDLASVILGKDEDGEDETSCVVRETAVPAAGMGADGQPYKPTEVERVVIEVMTERSKGQLAGIEIEHVINEAALRLPAKKDQRDTRRQRCRRALLKLCDMEEFPYALEDGCITIV